MINNSNATKINRFNEIKKETILLSIKELAESPNTRPRFFRIPEYQRGYAWKEKQVNDLWQDINLLFDLNDEGKKHYTGMLTLQEATDNADYAQESLVNKDCSELLYVVDGQQRLTTILILLSEIYRVAKKIDIKSTEIEDEIKTIFNEKSTPFFAYSKKRTDKDGDTLLNIFYEEKKDVTLSEKSYYSQNLINAANFLQEKINKLCSTDLNKLTKLYRIIANNLVFNLYYANNFNVSITFETMNNRGKELTVLEKLKNRLLYITTLIDTKNQLKLANVRTNIEKKWSEIYINLGKNGVQSDDDEFLKAHWICYFGITKKRGNNYENVLLNEQFKPLNAANLTIEQEEGKTDLADYCEKLGEFSKYWSQMLYPRDIKENKENKEDKENKEEISITDYITKLNHIGLTIYAKAYLTTLIRAYSKAESDTKEVIEKHLVILEKFLFIKKYIGKLRSDYSVFASKATKIYNSNNQNEIKNILKELETDLENNKDYGLTANKTNDKNAFIASIENLFKKEQGFYSWPGKYYFLYEYNQSLAKNVGREEKAQELPWNDYANQQSRSSLTVEHIYPQKPEKTESWAYAFNMYDESEKKCFKNAIGNLLPLARSINAKYQNYGYWVKAQGHSGELNSPNYSNGSLSEIKVTQNKKYNYWTGQAIKTRSIELLNFLSNRWELNFESKELTKLLNMPDLKENLIDYKKLKALYEKEISEAKEKQKSKKSN